MIFNSWAFVVFLISVLSIYWCLRKDTQNIFLIAASYFFYGWWDVRFLSLILISTLVDYWIAQKIHSESRKVIRFRWLLISICTNLGILGFFKYFNFFTDSFSGLASYFGWEPDFVTLNIILPVGISFYTFQTLSYTIDVYRENQKPTNNFSVFAIYVCYFPQLVAGPIERASRLIPAFTNKRFVSTTNLHKAFQLLLIGFFQKIAIADAVAPYVNNIFAEPDQMSPLSLVFGVILFSLQIYGDFCGYSNIARGTSLLLGIDLVINFKQPYLSTNITDFWRRWHISLSSWLKDYLYISLGGNRKGKYRTSANLFFTMALGGLWHGASWNFVIWGILHGIYLSIHKYWRSRIGVRHLPEKRRLLRILFGWILTYCAVCFAWIFFRSPDLSSSTTFILGIFDLDNLVFSKSEQVLLVMVCLYGSITLLVDYIIYKRGRDVVFSKEVPSLVRGTFYSIAILIIILVGENSDQPFIYFQF